MLNMPKSPNRHIFPKLCHAKHTPPCQRGPPCPRPPSPCATPVPPLRSTPRARLLLCRMPHAPLPLPPTSAPTAASPTFPLLPSHWPPPRRLPPSSSLLSLRAGRRPAASPTLPLLPPPSLSPRWQVAPPSLFSFPSFLRASDTPASPSSSALCFPSPPLYAGHISRTVVMLCLAWSSTVRAVSCNRVVSCHPTALRGQPAVKVTTVLRRS